MTALINFKYALNLNVLVLYFTNENDSKVVYLKM